jgi:hypothetical protein
VRHRPQVVRWRSAVTRASRGYAQPDRRRGFDFADVLAGSP